MSDPARVRRFAVALLALGLLAGGALAQEPENLLRNPSFEEAPGENGLPPGWSIYAGLDDNRRVTLVEDAADGQLACRIDDLTDTAEVGITQTVAAEGGVAYRASVKTKAAVPQRPVGCYLQMRFLPSNEYVQKPLRTGPGGRYAETSVGRLAPPDTTRITIYLYSHAGPTPQFIVDDVRLSAGAEADQETAVPPCEPPPIPKLKDLHLTTPIVADGRPAAVIVAPPGGRYAAAVGAIRDAVREITGVELPVVADDAPAVPFETNLICLGNRSTNRTLNRLYDLYYTLLDLKYPGPGGYAVHSLHNPFGNGLNALLVGGSDDAGVVAAAQVLVEKLRAAGGGRGNLTVGWLQEIRLSPQYSVPDNLAEVEIWEASAGYRSTGYFGWNSISKRMALYYMTGDPKHAREALRLAFPDAAAIAELAATDGEQIENKTDPLAGPYHYNAHLMILFWDLIEESPIFSDEERLKVTQAFARQLLHRREEGVYQLTEPGEAVGSRHGQYSALSLYTLGRYFNTYYPDPVWRQCLNGARLHFAPLLQSAWVAGENDNLFWFNTGIAPIFSYIVLSGDRGPLESGAAAELLRAQELLISGLEPDWALNSAALDYLNKVAYLTGDGRWLEYRRRTGVPTDGFRLGQSFWPDETLTPRQPEDLVGRWGFKLLPEPHWFARRNGFEPHESFEFGSFRSAPDATGDFILLDGFNGASRNPYHTFAILELRIAGLTVLGRQAYHNQVLTKADGMVEPRVAMDAALRHHSVTGGVAAAIAEVPGAAFCNWRRTLAQRVGRYALVVDDLTFRTDSRNMEVQTLWQSPNARWDAARQALSVQGPVAATLPPGWRRVRALDSPCTAQPGGEEFLRRLDSVDIMLLRATEPGAYLEQRFSLEEPFAGNVYAELLDYTDRGKVRCRLDSQPVGEEHDHRSGGIRTSRVALGHHALAAGEHALRVEVTARHEGLDKAYVGLLGVVLQPDGAPDVPAGAATFELRPCDPMPTTVAGGITRMLWRGAVREGEHRRLFTLIAPAGVGEAEPACVRIDDRTAALALPGPAVAAVGDDQGERYALAVLSATTAYGLRFERSAQLPWLSADAPVDFDWDFAAGRLSVEAAQPCALTLTAAPGAQVALDGTPVEGPVLRVEAGAHEVTGVRPPADALAALATRLADRLAEGRRQHQQRIAALDAGPAAPPETLTPLWTADIGGRADDLVVGGQPGETTIFVASDRTVHVLSATGETRPSLSADGPIRVLHDWPEADGPAGPLLLVGCKDEQVIAFDRSGRRAWVYVSEMDPAVFRAAKQYWFKSAPGHEGIHGLGSGPFLDGRQQAFVGSACTLEILNPDGSRAARLPIFWGCGSRFQEIDGPDGSINLLVAREPTDSHYLAIVNNRNLAEWDPPTVGNPWGRGRYGFGGAPAGHSAVGGWASMSRDHIFYADLDGDGRREVVSEINGSWNRVTVWDRDGNPLYNAQFGPGDAIPARNIRDLDLTDLDGDGRLEILVALRDGLVVALDAHCQRRWSVRLPSPPTVLAAVGPTVIVGCQDGAVARINSAGEVVAGGRINGRPTKIAKLPDDAVVVATDQGAVAAYRGRE